MQNLYVFLFNEQRIYFVASPLDVQHYILIEGLEAKLVENHLTKTYSRGNHNPWVTVTTHIYSTRYEQEQMSLQKIWVMEQKES